MSLTISPVARQGLRNLPAWYVAFDGGATKMSASIFPAGEDGAVVIEHEPLFTHTVRCGSYPRFDDVISDLLERARHAGYGSFVGLGLGVAGPIDNESRTVKFTNREEWGLIRFQDLADRLGVDLVVVNDLEAWGNYLYYGPPDGDLVTVRTGTPKGRIQAVGAPGGGNNISIADLDKKEPTACEFGHVPLFAITPEDIELLEYLFVVYDGGTPCIEDIISGPGLVNIYNFVLASNSVSRSKAMESSVWEEDQSLAIAQAAENHSDEYAVKAFEVYTRYLGAYAAVISLACGATNKVFLGGNARKDASRILENSACFNAGLTSARKISNPRELPVDIITNPQAPLIGTAFRTSRLLEPLISEIFK